MPEETKQKETKEAKATERPTNCMKCNKRLQRKRWYYRNGGYYCSRRCWKLTTAKNKDKNKGKKGS